MFDAWVGSIYDSVTCLMFFQGAHLVVAAVYVVVCSCGVYPSRGFGGVAQLSIDRGWRVVLAAGCD